MTILGKTNDSYIIKITPQTLLPFIDFEGNFDINSLNAGDNVALNQVVVNLLGASNLAAKIDGVIGNLSSMQSTLTTIRDNL